ncbi:MAG: TonB-dependent receptor [Bryobacteraceae bacterium]|nr:TonB-dependent receptor [Bryobacteraceae bacterium]
MRFTTNLNRWSSAFLRLAFGALLLALTPLTAQYTTASLGGAVSDSSGAILPDAKVTVRNVETGFTQTVNSGPAGAYLFSRLPVGAYSLSVEKQGFSTYVQDGLRLTVDQMANQNVSLQVGQVSERITVTAEAELMQTRTSTGGQLVSKKSIEELPLQGRRPERLVYLAAGTVDLGRNACRICGHGGVYPGQETAGVNGAGIGQVNFQLDGTSHNDTYLNASLPFPNPDTVQEFNLQSSNFSAEFGNAAGGVVNIVARSGTNEIHGTAFNFLRNGALNSRQFFAPVQDSLKRNQFGGTIGGPIVKNKLFYFGSYQGTRVRNTPAGIIRFVPTAAERTGDFSALSRQLVDPVSRLPVPGNRISASRLNPVSNYFLNWIPLPNGPAGQLTFPGVPIQETENQYMAKVDYNTGSHQLAGRFFMTDFERPAGIPGERENILAARSGNEVRVTNLSLNHIYGLRPTLLANTTFGMNLQRGGSLSGAPFGFKTAGAKVVGPEDSPLKAPPALNLSVTDGFGIGTGHRGIFDRGDYTIREVVTWIKGKHDFRFGGEAVRVHNPINNTFQMMGNYTFNGQLSGNGLADFMFGRASEFRQGGGEFKDLLGTRWSFFVQDNWRVTNRLTLNLGVRWDPYLPYYDRQGRVVCFQPNSGQRSQRYPNAPIGMLYGGETPDVGCPQAGSRSDWANISPRLGFAYRLTDDGRTSLRGGVGIFYTPIQTSNMNPYTNIAPFAGTFTINDVAFEDPYGSTGMANPFPANFGPTVPGKDFVFFPNNDIRAYFAPDYQIPQLASWSLRLERQFGKDWVASVAYIGNKGTFLQYNIDENPAIFRPGATVGNTQQRRIYPDFARVRRTDSGGNSQFHSAQFNLEKRFGRGYSILTNYTWSRTIDDAQGGSDVTNPFNRRHNRGLATEDIEHNFKFSNIYDLPRFNVQGFGGKVVNGWQVNAIVIAQSGFPFTVTSGRDNSFSGVNLDRADFLGGSATLPSGRTRDEQLLRWFDISKFTANAIGTFGNSGRNIVRGPNFFQTDFSVIKNTAVNERFNVQFRAEFFNLLNNANFRIPNSNAASAQFGRVTQVVDESQRIVQMALKLSF